MVILGDDIYFMFLLSHHLQNSGWGNLNFLGGSHALKMISFEGERGGTNPGTHAGYRSFPGFGKPFPSANYKERSSQVDTLPLSSELSPFLKITENKRINTVMRGWIPESLYHPVNCFCFLLPRVPRNHVNNLCQAVQTLFVPSLPLVLGFTKELGLLYHFDPLIL